MGLLDQFIDLFYANKKQDFLNKMFDFIHNVKDAQNDADFVAIRQIMADAPLDALKDFFSANNDKGQSILHIALKWGHTSVVVAYQAFLKLLPENRRAALLPDLLAASDRQGNPGLSWALELGHTDAILAYKSLLASLPPEQINDHLVELLTAKDQVGDRGLALAMTTGAAAPVNAYRELLELLTPEQRATHLEELLIAPDAQGVPGLIWAKKLQKNPESAVTAYRDWLESVIDKTTHSRLVGVLAALNAGANRSLHKALAVGDNDTILAHHSVLDLIPENQPEVMLQVLAAKQSGDPGLLVALKNGHVGAILAYKTLLERIPETARTKTFTQLIAAKGSNGKSGLALAMENGHADAVHAYKSLLELLPLSQRNEQLFNIFDKQLGLVHACHNGHAEVIRAYKGLLQLLPPAKRDAHLVSLLAVKNRNHRAGLFFAVAQGHADAITAYKELLELLTVDQLRDHLGDILAPNSDDPMPVLYWALASRNANVIIAYEQLLTLIPPGAHDDVLQKILTIYFDARISTTRNHEADFFNHLENTSHCSLLTMINNIGDQHQDLKNKYMIAVYQLMKKLKVVPTNHAQAFMDIWINHPHYATDPGIAGIIRTELTPAIIASGNTKKLIASDKIQTQLIKEVQIIVAKEGVGEQAAKKGTFMLNNNGFFVQLMSLCANHPDPATKKAAHDLYDQYLNLDELRQHKIRLADLGYKHGIQGSGDVEPLDPIAGDDPAYLFVSQKPGSKSYDGLMLSKDQISGMLSLGEPCDWSNSTFVTETRGPTGKTIIDFVANTKFKPVETFPQFALFRIAFETQSRQVQLHKLMALLNLKHSNGPGLPDTDYTNAFIKAFTARSSQTKFISQEHLDTLDQIFSRFLTGPVKQNWSMESLPAISDAHIAAVLKLFRPDTADSITSARVLFCLAAVFAKLSSSTYFGVSLDSPIAVRVYAAGLLKKACEINPAVCIASDYKEFMQRMLGIGSAFSCTGVLSDMMMDHAKKQPDFKAVLMMIKPIAWT